MRLKQISISGFKSFNNKSELTFPDSITSVVGPNGSGKSNIVEAFRFVLGEQSMKSMRGKKGEDLIFNGGSGSGRANRASVKISFNNKDNFFDLEFDQIEIERVVYRDGNNEYYLNGTQVRLRDILELLSKANIGSTGHHIISQGEADRILNSSPMDRKSIIEDGLGLKFLQYRKIESEKKIQKTRENLKEVQISRREIAPHLNYLKKQVQLIEEVKEMKQILFDKYLEYLKREEVFIEKKEKDIDSSRKILKIDLDKVNKEIQKLKGTEEEETDKKRISIEIKEKEKELEAIRKEKDGLNIKIGRLEGEVSARDRILKEDVSKSIPIEQFNNAQREIKELENTSKSITDTNELKSIISKIVSTFNKLLSSETSKSKEEVNILNEELNSLNKTREGIQNNESMLSEKINQLKLKLDEIFTKNIEMEKVTIDLISQKNQIEKDIQKYSYEEQSINDRKIEFERELAEGKILVGDRIIEYKKEEIDINSIINEENKIQKTKRKELERLKIRLEEKNISNDQSVLAEYNKISEHDKKLELEVQELETSIGSLVKVIEDLEKEIKNKFRSGIAQINSQFEIFFRTLFGGGKAKLQTVKIQSRDLMDDSIKEGIEVSVSLPQKKTSSLEQLSGGERALVSIALLFAISQVTPPPFLILDETDAALDEANSKRYGDMIEELAKHSQLILVTHNRETMSRAGIIYGVTIDRNGVSKLLSVKLQEALKVAK